MEELIIVGGGIGGLALAAGLKKRGIKATVLEATPVLKPVGAGILLANNAQLALEHMGIQRPIFEVGHPMKVGEVLDKAGNSISDQPTMDGFRPYLGIHRAQLHECLLMQLDADQVKLGQRIANVEQKDEFVRMTTDAGKEWEARHIIAFDGINSAIRLAVGDTRPTRYAGYTCWRGIGEGWTGPNHRFTETWGTGARFGIVPLGGTKTYWFATYNAPPRDKTYAQYSIDEVRNLFAGYHSEVESLLACTPNNSLYWNDIEDLPPVKRLAYGRVILAGDAGHATTPNLGQGAGMALEDAATLTTLLSKGLSWKDVGVQFEALRIARTAWVTQTSWRFGKVGQWTHPLAIAIRNGMAKRTPQNVMRKQLTKLANVTFGE